LEALREASSGFLKPRKAASTREEQGPTCAEITVAPLYYSMFLSTFQWTSILGRISYVIEVFNLAATLVMKPDVTVVINCVLYAVIISDL
jgi:hypothetical protein